MKRDLIKKLIEQISFKIIDDWQLTNQNDLEQPPLLLNNNLTVSSATAKNKFTSSKLLFIYHLQIKTQINLLYFNRFV